MRTLVTGADGFLGANLCQELVWRGHDVVGSALNRKGKTGLDALGVDIRVEYGDVLDLAYLRRLVNAHEIDWVFHLAAVSIVRVAENDPYRAIQTNVMGTLNVLDAARGAKAVVVASSDKAYGDYGGVAYSETMPLKPQGAYELSKALEDTLARGWARFTDARVMVTRCGNLYGPGDVQFSRLIPNSCRRIVNGVPPEVHPGAWAYSREWLYVQDAAAAYITLAKKGQTGEAYNIGSDETATAGGVAHKLAELGAVGKPVDSNYEITEIPSQRLCSSKMRRLGWSPQTTLDIGLSNTLLWYRQYLGGPCGF